MFFYGNGDIMKHLVVVTSFYDNDDKLKQLVVLVVIVVAVVLVVVIFSLRIHAENNSLFLPAAISFHDNMDNDDNMDNLFSLHPSTTTMAS